MEIYEEFQIIKLLVLTFFTSAFVLHSVWHPISTECMEASFFCCCCLIEFIIFTSASGIRVGYRIETVSFIIMILLEQNFVFSASVILA